MPHCDQETLSLIALGEPVPAKVTTHVAGCVRCQAELDALHAVVAAVRPQLGDSLDGLTPVAPPPAVWQRIAADTGVSSAPRRDRMVGSTVRTPTPVTPTPVATPVQARRGPASRHPADAGSRRSSRGRRKAPSGARRLVAVAASALVIGIVGGVVGTLTLRPPDRDDTTVLSRTELAGLALAPAASGEADVVQTTHERQLDLDVTRLGAPDGYYEVWLIDPTVTKMVPIGVLHGSQGEFALPDGVSLQDYPVIDVSIQPLNGNPKHSGRSVLRGTIGTVSSS